VLILFQFARADRLTKVRVGRLEVYHRFQSVVLQLPAYQPAILLLSSLSLNFQPQRGGEAGN